MENRALSTVMVASSTPRARGDPCLCLQRVGPRSPHAPSPVPAPLVPALPSHSSRHPHQSLLHSQAARLACLLRTPVSFLLTSPPFPALLRGFTLPGLNAGPVPTEQKGRKRQAQNTVSGAVLSENALCSHPHRISHGDGSYPILGPKTAIP